MNVYNILIEKIENPSPDGTCNLRKTSIYNSKVDSNNNTKIHNVLFEAEYKYEIFNKYKAKVK